MAGDRNEDEIKAAFTSHVCLIKPISFTFMNWDINTAATGHRLGKKKKGLFPATQFPPFQWKWFSFLGGIYNFRPSSPVFPCIQSYSRGLAKAIHFNALRTRFKGGHDPWPARQYQRAVAPRQLQESVYLPTHLFNLKERTYVFVLVVSQKESWDWSQCLRVQARGVSG